MNKRSEVIEIRNACNNNTGNKINLRTRTIIIYGTIDEFLAKEISNNIYDLDTAHDDPINIKLNSMGGYLYDAQTIITELLSCRNDINISIVGCAFSAAALIALTGDNIKMSQYGSFMLHYPQWKTSYMTLHEHELDIKTTKEYFERIVTSLLTKTNITMDEFKQKAKTDWYLSPKNCLKRKIVDEIY